LVWRRNWGRKEVRLEKKIGGCLRGPTFVKAHCPLLLDGSSTKVGRQKTVSYLGLGVLDLHHWQPGVLSELTLRCWHFSKNMLVISEWHNAPRASVWTWEDSRSPDEQTARIHWRCALMSWGAEVQPLDVHDKVYGIRRIAEKLALAPLIVGLGGLRTGKVL